MLGGHLGGSAGVERGEGCLAGRAQSAQAGLLLLLLLQTGARAAVGRGRGAASASGGGLVVLFEVAVEVGLLAEAAVAEATLEGALLVVDVAHVALQIGRDAEAALAVAARVGLLAGVRAQVARQVGRAGKVLAAIVARVPLGPELRQLRLCVRLCVCLLLCLLMDSLPSQLLLLAGQTEGESGARGRPGRGETAGGEEASLLQTVRLLARRTAARPTGTKGRLLLLVGGRQQVAGAQLASLGPSHRAQERAVLLEGVSVLAERLVAQLLVLLLLTAKLLPLGLLLTWVAAELLALLLLLLLGGCGGSGGGQQRPGQLLLLARRVLGRPGQLTSWLAERPEGEGRPRS